MLFTHYFTQKDDIDYKEIFSLVYIKKLTQDYCDFVSLLT